MALSVDITETTYKSITIHYNLTGYPYHTFTQVLVGCWPYGDASTTKQELFDVGWYLGADGEWEDTIEISNLTPDTKYSIVVIACLYDEDDNAVLDNADTNGINPVTSSVPDNYEPDLSNVKLILDESQTTTSVIAVYIDGLDPYFQNPYSIVLALDGTSAANVKDTQIFQGTRSQTILFQRGLTSDTAYTCSWSLIYTFNEVDYTLEYSDTVWTKPNYNQIAWDLNLDLVITNVTTSTISFYVSGFDPNYFDPNGWYCNARLFNSSDDDTLVDLQKNVYGTNGSSTSPVITLSFDDSGARYELLVYVFYYEYGSRTYQELNLTNLYVKYMIDTEAETPTGENLKMIQCASEDTRSIVAKISGFDSWPWGYYIEWLISENGTKYTDLFTSKESGNSDSDEYIFDNDSYEMQANTYYYIMAKVYYYTSNTSKTFLCNLIEKYKTGGKTISMDSAYIVGSSSSDGKSFTCYVDGLDLGYDDGSALIEWYLDFLNSSGLKGTTTIYNTTKSSSYTFTGLNPGTSYAIWAKIIWLNYGTECTKTIGYDGTTTDAPVVWTGIQVAQTDKTGTSMTVKVTGLDTAYSRADRKITWYCDGTSKATVALSASISETPTYTITGLSPNTCYTIKATITYTESGTTKTKDVSKSLYTATWATQQMTSIGTVTSTKTVTWSIQTNYVHYATVKFSTAGTVTFSASNSYGYYGYLSTTTEFNNSAGFPTSYVKSGVGASGFSFSYQVAAGTTYYIWVHASSGSSGSVVLTFSAPKTWSLVSAGSYSGIKQLNNLGTLSIAAGKVYQYTLTFANAGKVSFYSSGSLDVKAYLGTSSTINATDGTPTSYLVVHDDISTTDKNFSFTYTVSAGTTYYLFVRHSYDIDATGSTTVYIDPTNKPSDFSWTYTKTKGVTFNLTASEWNALQTKVNEVREYQASKSGKTIPTISFTQVSKGETFTADHFNIVLNGIAGAYSELGTTGLYNENAVNAGDIITADCLNKLVTLTNELIDK